MQMIANTQNNTISTSQTTKTTSATTDETSSFSCIGQVLKSQGVPKGARMLIIDSWTQSTKKQYDGYIR
ncbi:hypothetical protein DPMN_121614 [Dreissena polymorpha]|uniref:Uncharacterized protein n=1 Tax=Dreissena polymorpha TaxID=45954 RepID=A0A9D4GTX0_DREPO|nr:hypothetical protein DPMN_121614 [Dreissena polymorpha]